MWLFNCLIALKAKFQLCKGSIFIVRLMTYMLKDIHTTMQAFIRITGLICSCLVVWCKSTFFIQKLIYILIEDTMKERDKGE